MPKPPKKPKSTGARRMRQLGKIASQLWYTPEQYELVKKAATMERRAMTNFAIMATVKAAQRVLCELHDVTVELMKTKGVRNYDKT